MKHQSTWDNPDFNLELFFCTEVLKLNSLHYGYWEKEENKIDLENVRRAQQRYTDTLLDMIPADVHDILDIGCGIGDNARALAARGYHVTAISPDKAHAAYFKDVDPAQIEFENTTVEKYNSQRIYDLVLMSESQGYFAMDTGFSQSVRHLRPGGYLLVSGIFKQDLRKDTRGSHVEDDYIACAQGFNLIERDYRDITHNTLPTLQYAFDCYNNYIGPLYQILLHFIGETGLKKALVMKALFASELRNLSEVCHYYEEHFNPDLFNKRMRYSRILFRYEPNAFEKTLIQNRALKPAVSVIVCAYNEEQTIEDNLTFLAGCAQWTK
jgi:MPBQ/MSBQ methyltransferase